MISLNGVTVRGATMKRRRFLAIATAGSAALPVLARGRALPAMQQAASSGIDLAIFDDSFQEAHHFGRTMRRAGVTVRSFPGDVTALWSGYLDVRWRKSADSVAGLTDKDCFFCLSQMAVSHGVYPKFWIEHVLTAGGSIAHVINGPADAVDRAAGKLAAASDRVPDTARLLASLDPEHTSGIVRKSVDAGIPGPGGDIAGPRDLILVSWLMAPTRQTRLTRRVQFRR